MINNLGLKIADKLCLAFMIDKELFNIAVV